MDNPDLRPADIEKTLNHSVKEWADLQSEIADAENELDSMQKQLEESERWQTHATIKAEAKARVDTIKAELRNLAIEYFEKTGRKTAHEAVKVRVTTRVKYDITEAENWSREHLPEAFKFDTRTFENYVKRVREIRALDFVSFEEEPQPALARDVSAYGSLKHTEE